jgi:outer membrane immunogenic protein
MAPPFSWTGCYAGLNAGGISTRLDHSVEVPNIAPLPVTFGASDRDVGFIGGVQAGCNYQFNPNWAIGLEGDINYADTNHDGPFRFTRGSEDLVGSASTRLRWLSTVRGRLGTTWGSTFLYVTGGLAIGKVEASVSATNRIGPIDTIYAGSHSQTRLGSTIGAGIEHAFSNRVSAKFEYLHYDLGSTGYAANPAFAGLPQWSASTKLSGDILRVGFNVKLSP